MSGVPKAVLLLMVDYATYWLVWLALAFVGVGAAGNSTRAAERAMMFLLAGGGVLALLALAIAALGLWRFLPKGVLRVVLLVGFGALLVVTLFSQMLFLALVLNR